MRITKNMLKQIIREELSDVIHESDIVPGAAPDAMDSPAAETKSYTLDEVGSMVKELVGMVSNLTGEVPAGGEWGLHEAKPAYAPGKSAKERMHGKDKPKTTEPTKAAPKKTDLQKAEERVKRAKDKLAKDPQNAGLKKRLASAKKALERARRAARGL